MLRERIIIATSTSTNASIINLTKFVPLFRYTCIAFKFLLLNLKENASDRRLKSKRDKEERDDRRLARPNSSDRDRAQEWDDRERRRDEGHERFQSRDRERFESRDRERYRDEPRHGSHKSSESERHREHKRSDDRDSRKRSHSVDRPRDDRGEDEARSKKHRRRGKFSESL